MRQQRFFSSFLRSLGNAVGSTLLSLLREVGFGVGLALLLPVWFGLDGILYFMAGGDVLTFIAVAVALVHTAKELKKSRFDCKKLRQNDTTLMFCLNF